MSPVWPMVGIHSPFCVETNCFSASFFCECVNLIVNARWTQYVCKVSSRFLCLQFKLDCFMYLFQSNSWLETMSFMACRNRHENHKKWKIKDTKPNDTYLRECRCFAPFVWLLNEAICIISIFLCVWFACYRENLSAYPQTYAKLKELKSAASKQTHKWWFRQAQTTCHKFTKVIHKLQMLCNRLLSVTNFVCVI